MAPQEDQGKIASGASDLGPTKWQLWWRRVLGATLLVLPLILFGLLVALWPTVESPEVRLAQAQNQTKTSAAIVAVNRLAQAQRGLISTENQLQSAKDKLKRLTENKDSEAKAKEEAKKAVATAQALQTAAITEHERATTKAEKTEEAASKSAEKLAQKIRTAPTPRLVSTRILGSLNPEILLFIIVMISGAIGSSVFMARSFAYHMGADDFEDSFMWWYWLRLPIGMGIAVMIYLVLRGGLFAGSFAEQSKAIDAVNPFGFAALATLAGMFSRQATEKLEEIFNNIFTTSSKSAARPKITPFADTTLKVGATGKGLNLTVTGENFNEQSTVQINGKDRKTVRQGSKKLEATLKKEDVTEATTLTVTVRNLSGEGGTSEPEDVIVVKD